jgi:Asp/Glu/hydantoin racemase
MGKRIAFVHTVASLPPVFKSLMAELAPDLDVYHMVDESLLQNTIRSGELSKATIRRLVQYLALAEEAGADVVMVTCSSIGPAADIGRQMVDIPVLRVDEAMAEKALAGGHRIGVAATLSTTLQPTAALIERKASEIQRKAGESGNNVQVVSKLCAGAFEALMAGDSARHDALVAEGLRELIPNVDVIVLAQASMARIVDNLPDADKVVPIYSSPRLAVEHLARTVAASYALQ